MTLKRLAVVLGIVVLLLLLAGGIIWWYLFGANEVAAAELVPSDTIAFATIPNAATLATGYQSSKLKTLADSPTLKPAFDYIKKALTDKNLDLLQSFAPNLSGQSFIALTHLDPDKPAEIGLIAAMKPKLGMNNFDAFVDKLKAAYPDGVTQAATGVGNVSGVDYKWIKGPGAPDKICVAQYRGWIVTTWGEAPLQDWVARIKKTSSSPSLAQNPDYIKSLANVGKDPTTILYLDYHQIMSMVGAHLAKTDAHMGDYFNKQLANFGGAMIASRFENGEIVDRFYLLLPRQAQLDAGLSPNPCTFDTLKFTGPNTLLYVAMNFNFSQYWKNIQEQFNTPQFKALGASPDQMLQTWAKSAGLDVQRNIFDALGSEVSFQVEWNSDTTYPEAGLFVKLDKPDDFQPTIKAIIDACTKVYAQTAVVNELKAPTSGQEFSELKFVQASPIVPVITRGGNYLGLFISENQAVRSYERDPATTLTANADFIRQIGDKRKGASSLIFLDSPRLLDDTYKAAAPFLPFAAMANKQVAEVVKNLPSDMSWLAPMGTWSLVVTLDDAGESGYSVSGIGNQEMFYGGILGASVAGAYGMGLIPNAKPAFPGPRGNSPYNPTMPPPTPNLPSDTPPSTTPPDDTTTPPPSAPTTPPTDMTPSAPATPETPSTPPAAPETPAPAPTPAPAAPPADTPPPPPPSGTT